MHENIDMYGPCPCGSGKKYKFCCHQRKQAHNDAAERPRADARAASWREQYAKIQIPRLDEAMALNQQGVQHLGEGRLEQAIPLLRQAVSLAPAFVPAANNLALALFYRGDLDSAIAVQRESAKSSPLLNAFGLANLASFLYVAGREKEAERCLDRVRGMEMLSDDICVKVCETLARFKRHQDILELAATAGFVENASSCFFTGVAAANMGDRERALRDLKRAVFSRPFGDRVKRHLEWLRDGTEPYTVLGDWPYLEPPEVLPVAIITRLRPDDKQLNAFRTRRVLVDFCEAGLNEKPGDAIHLITFLGLSKHPASSVLLKAVAYGRFGPDTLREAALQTLDMRGELPPGEAVKVFRDGQWCEVRFAKSELNPRFQFGIKLPGRLNRQYAAAVEEGLQDDPDWEKQGRIFLDVYKQAPEHYPALFNYAVSLLHRDRLDEAESLLHDLMREHPDYLFARAALLNIYCMDGRLDAAKKLAQTGNMPAETHPDAMVAWYLALFNYFEQADNDAMADRYLQLAQDINPDNPTVKRLLG